ncbi:hypothetical protein GGI07_002253 [Coemansia sp. Benny D115]|nr:hypothetical protein GGI07_002253 [Coemansia sp. Benny D115]
MATQVLFLRSTTQIDRLMQLSSVLVQQRWDFLGPKLSADAKANPPTSALFAQIDDALQWHSDEHIGEYIRHAHFALELTEEQREVLCPEHILYELTDAHTIHAYAPFASCSREIGQNGDERTLVVDLVWEMQIDGDEASGRWAYFDTRALGAKLSVLVDPARQHGSSASDGIRGIAQSIAAAKDLYMNRFAGNSRNACAHTDSCNRDEDAEDEDEDDSYWNQFPQPEAPVHAKEKTGNISDKAENIKSANTGGEKVDDDANDGDDDDYWGQYGQESDAKSDDDDNDYQGQSVPHISQQPSMFETKVADSVRLSLAAAASAAKAIGMAKDDFLKLAAASFSNE